MAKYPAGLPRAYRYHWNHPWRQSARLNLPFRRWLGRHGYLTPHFKKADAACKDGTPVPHALIKDARNHAFNLERLRHRLGDKPIPILSWYRTRAYNQRIGGASQSQHINAVATDMSREWVEQVGRSNFDREADIVFRDGGVGRYPAGSVHVDTRGFRARWTSF